MKTLKVISLVLTLLLVGFLIVDWGEDLKLGVPSSSEKTPQAEGTGPGDVGPVVALKPFVVSAWEGNEQHIGTVTFEMEVRDDSARDTVKARTSKIRSEIMEVLADTQLTAIANSEDFAALKATVQSRVQALLPKDTVRRVLITDFLSK